MPQNDEVLLLVRQCRRAKTVQILQGHDAVSFTITMALVKNRPKFDVNLCHISPVKGKGCIGLFHYKNLFYGGSYQNKKIGNKSFGKGLSIKTTELLKTWSVSEQTSTNDILIKIELYLGGVIEEYLKLSSVRKSKKVQISNKICTLDDTECFDDLIQISHTTLVAKLSKLSNSPTFKLPEQKRESKYINYIDKLSRFISYKDTGWRHLTTIRGLMITGYLALSKIKESNTYNKDITTKYQSLINPHRDAKLKSKTQWSEFKDAMYEAAFHALQGETASLKALERIMSKYLKTSKLNTFK